MSDSRRVAGQPNAALRLRMQQAGLSENRLASRLGVEPKTIHRWLAGETVPQARNAQAVAETLDCDAQDIWPDIFPALDPPSPGTVPVSAYASRAEIPMAVWSQHFSEACDQIDVCVYGGTFLFDAVPAFPSLLARAAARGAHVRFLIGDPHSTAIQQRGREEGIGESLAARCQLTLARLRSMVTEVPVEVRLHRSTLYVSMFRADDTLIANHHIYGHPASDNPTFVIDRAASPDLWTKYQRSFDRIWTESHPPLD